MLSFTLRWRFAAALFVILRLVLWFTSIWLLILLFFHLGIDNILEMRSDGIEEGLKLVHQLVNFLIRIFFKIDKIILDGNWRLLHRHFVLGQVLDDRV